MRPMDTGAKLTLTFIGLFVFVVVLFIVTRLRAWKTRRRKLADWAQQNGMQFTEGPTDASPFAPLPGLQVRGEVTSCEARHVARGLRAEMPVVVFDLLRSVERRYRRGTKYETRFGTFALFERRERQLPYFDFSVLSAAGTSTFRGKAVGFVTNLAVALGAELGGKDVVTLEGRPGFLLRGSDEAAIRAVFSPSLLEFFDQNPGWTVEAEGPHILVGLQAGLVFGWTTPQIENLVAYQDFDRFLPLAAAIAQRL